MYGEKCVLFFEFPSRAMTVIILNGLQQFCSINHMLVNEINTNRKWQDYVYIQCEYKSTKQKIKHLLREENKVKENKIS